MHTIASAYLAQKPEAMKKMYYLLLCCILIVAACKDEDDGGPEIVIPPVPDGVTDVRAEFSVTTLTEPFDGSGGASVDAAGFIYVGNFGDQLNNANGKEVRKVDPVTGDVSLFATGMDGASGNAFDSDGNLIQASIRGDFLSVITPEGEVDTLTDSDLLGPVGVAIDSQGDIFVCNCNGNRISKVSPDGTASVFVSGNSFRCPNGLTIDGEDNLYAVNFSDNRVLKITPEGDISEVVRLPGNSNAHLEFWEDKLYVVGRQRGQIFEVDLEGNVKLIAGTGVAGDEDGDGNVAQFYIPNGIALSPDGQKIYIIDRVRALTGGNLNPVVVRVIEKN